MKKFKKFLYGCGHILCMVAMFIAIHSVNITCTGKYYQPLVPNSMDKYRK